MNYLYLAIHRISFKLCLTSIEGEWSIVTKRSCDVRDRDVVLKNAPAMSILSCRML